MFRKFERHIRSVFLKAIMAGRFDENKAFIISSTPRSGSTLLSQVLSAIPNSCTLFEPLHLDNVKEAKTVGFDWRSYLYPREEWPEGEAYLKRVFRGEVLNGWTVREISYHDGSQADRLIVKFVRANRLYPWLCQHFDLPAPILLMRHPCAVVSSQLGYGWNGKEKSELPVYLHKYSRFRNVHEQILPGVESLSAKWAFDQMPVLMEPRPHPWMIITYEELLLRPRETLARITDEWKVKIDIDEALSKLNKPSSVVNGIKKTINGIDGWKQKLSKEQISQILTTVKAFGISFYDERSEPDYKKLYKDNHLHAIIAAGMT